MDETTQLSPIDEKQFQGWANTNGIQAEDDGGFGHYDMRGYWRDIASKGLDQTEVNTQDGLRHFPDTYKQHGHPTFSVESKYSKGAWDGGMWGGDNHDQYIPQMSPMASHVVAGIRKAASK